MRTIGLLGGMSWESSALYYRLVNTEVRERLGGTHSASSIMHSFDFATIEALQERGDWTEAGRRLAVAAVGLERAGAEMIVLCTNTMHQLAGVIEAAVTIPFLHIGDTTGEAVLAAGHHTVGLLATRYTMEQDFYRGRMEQRYGLKVLTPDEPDRDLVHSVIYEELVRGVVDEGSRREYERIVAGLFAAGATGVILGCTEIELLVPPDSDPRLFPSTALHARAAVDLALRPEG